MKARIYTEEEVENKRCGKFRVTSGNLDFSKKYNHLNPLCYGSSGTGKTGIFCRCDCGNIILCKRADLESGRVKSCGCFTVEDRRHLAYGKFLIQFKDIFEKYDINPTYEEWKANKIPYICPKHGATIIKKYQLAKGFVCPKCGDERGYAKRTKTTEQFIQEAKAVHGDKYNYDKTVYNGARNYLIITCPKHGDFMQVAGCHLAGNGCDKCACTERGLEGRLPSSEYLARAIKIHGDKYDLSELNYIKSTEPVYPICRIHGKFSIIPASFLRGGGCPLCSGNIGGYSRKEAGLLYIVRWFNDKIQYIKFGVTNLTAEARQKVIKATSSLDFEILNYYQFEDGSIPWELEKRCKSELDTNICPVDLMRKGHTETISYKDLPKLQQLVNNYIKEYNLTEYKVKP